MCFSNIKTDSLVFWFSVCSHKNVYYFLLTHSVLRVIHPIQKLIPNNLVTQNRESAFSFTTPYSLFTYIHILVELAL